MQTLGGNHDGRCCNENADAVSFFRFTCSTQEQVSASCGATETRCLRDLHEHPQPNDYTADV